MYVYVYIYIHMTFIYIDKKSASIGTFQASQKKTWRTYITWTPSHPGLSVTHARWFWDRFQRSWWRSRWWHRARWIWGFSCWATLSTHIDLLFGRKQGYIIHKSVGRERIFFQNHLIQKCASHQISQSWVPFHKSRIRFSVFSGAQRIKYLIVSWNPRWLLIRDFRTLVADGKISS